MKVLTFVARALIIGAGVVVLVPAAIVAIAVLIAGALAMFLLWLGFYYLGG
jgi:hypothetical protein